MNKNLILGFLFVSLLSINKSYGDQILPINVTDAQKRTFVLDLVPKPGNVLIDININAGVGTTNIETFAPSSPPYQNSPPITFYYTINNQQINCNPISLYTYPNYVATSINLTIGWDNSCTVTPIYTSSFQSKKALEQQKKPQYKIR